MASLIPCVPVVLSRQPRSLPDREVFRRLQQGHFSISVVHWFVHSSRVCVSRCSSEDCVLRQRPDLRAGGSRRDSTSPSRALELLGLVTQIKSSALSHNRFQVS